MSFILNSKEISFLLIDVQGTLFNVIHDNKAIELNMKLLLRLRNILNIHLIVTTQNAPKLGPTIDSLSALFSKNQKEIDKLTFSCLKVPNVLTELEANNSKTLVLFGIEAHICVYQTAIDALRKKFNVIVVTDAVSSRTLENKLVAFEQLRHSGVSLLSTEMVIYELLGEAGTNNFRAILPFLKDPSKV